MSFDIPDPINRNYEDGASALIVDIRGSSEIVREKSYSNSIETHDNEALTEHTEFMMQLFRCVFEYIESLRLGDCFAFNDTGDGCLCVFWNDKHPLTCIRVASAIHKHLSLNEYVERNNIRFGIGCHTGGCVVYRTSSSIKKDFVFGIVANTAARVETFTKSLRDAKNNPQDDPRLLFTGNFKQHLEPLLERDEKKRIAPISNNRFNLNDGKDEGHFLYTITKPGMDFRRHHGRQMNKHIQREKK